ncbi:uncharacterized protein B0T23DRAFT_100879 [Neurospora hispaniola]|uniref:Rhodopsin domain-containing protein n=1 Tax=Neurospora hispaniola TaxID=588809 RepID=A0AAJ0IE56_9PEZI|nr:hypothetical protein B0T23DRAFT_100879 [Neurospora hispaniola]
MNSTANNTTAPSELCDPYYIWPPASERAHDSLRPNIYASTVICWLIAALFVGLRLYTRSVIIRVLGPTDWSILAALVFSLATSVGTIEQAINGSGLHVWDIDCSDAAAGIAWYRASWYSLVFYTLCLYFSKASILLLYIHLFNFRWARLGGQILLSIVTISHVYMLAVCFVATIPLNSYWDSTIQRQWTAPQSMWWSSTGLHMATDFLIFLLPLPVVWSVMLPKRQKIALSVVFGFGFVICFISILRLLKLLKVQTTRNHPTDWAYNAAELTYLTALECNGAIVCACVMTLRPFIVKYFPKLLASHSRYPIGSNGQGGRLSDSITPPTIGSKPFKPPVSPAEAVYMRRERTNAWMDGGYVELDNTWEGFEGAAVNDVEMKEGVGNKKEKNGEKEHLGVRRWNSLRTLHHHHDQKGGRSTGEEDGIQVRRSVDVTVQVAQSREHENEDGSGNENRDRASEVCKKGTAL